MTWLEPTRMWGVVLLGAMALMACEAGPPKVRSPRWSKDTCHTCRMAVTEPPHAAQLVGPGTQVRYYDDLGCALKEQLSHSAPAEAKLYVLSPQSSSEEVWLPASEVRFVGHAKTPMNYGYTPASDGTLTIDAVTSAVRERFGREWQLPAEGAHE